MSKQCALLLVTVLFFGFAGFHADAEPLRVVVVTGGHGYEKEAFEDIFIQNTDIACTFYKLQDDSELFEEISDWHYDVIVLYNMSRRISEKRQQNLLQLLDQGVGLVVLHHAIAAFSDWKEYRKIIGARYWLEDMEEDGIAILLASGRKAWTCSFTWKIRDTPSPGELKISRSTMKRIRAMTSSRITICC